MADRILTWYIEEPFSGETQGATFCLDKDYYPICVRAYTSQPSDSGDLLIDILDDGVSILTNQAAIQPNQSELDWFEDFNEAILDKYSFISLKLTPNGAKRITVQLELEILDEDEEDEDPI
jgi:hypothetical protein